MQAAGIPGLVPAPQAGMVDAPSLFVARPPAPPVPRTASPAPDLYEPSPAPPPGEPCPTPPLQADPDPSPPRKEWTLLFYHAGYADESKMCTGSLVDLERVGSDANTDVVVMNQRTRWLPEKVLGLHAEFDGARTYHVEKGPERAPAWYDRFLPDDAGHLARFARSSPSDVTSPEVSLVPADANPGDPQVLKAFLLDAMARYPAKHYALFISGHGAAFGGQAIVHHPDARIKNEQLGAVLEDVAKAQGHKIDLVNLNTCFGANLETLYPLRHGAEAAVASEGPVFAATQPFAKVVADVQKGVREGLDLSGSDVARLCVEEARRQPLGNLYTETLSAVDLRRIDDVTSAVKRLQDAVVSENVDPALVRAAWEKSHRIDYSSVPRQVWVTDIGSFADAMATAVPAGPVHEAATATKVALSQCVLAEQHGDHLRETVTSQALRFALRKHEEDLSRLSGLTFYTDDDAHGKGSRLEQIGRTDYAKEVQPQAFIEHLSRVRETERAAMTPLQQAVEAIRQKHEDLDQKVTEATHLPGGLRLLERLGTGVGMLAGFHALGSLGIPAYPLIFGPYFAVRGAIGMAKGTASTVSLARQPESTVQKREGLVSAAAQVALGAATSTFGLYVLGVLPHAVAWPAAIAAVSIQVGCELGKLVASRPERQAVQEEATRFAALSTAEKLEVSRDPHHQTGGAPP